MWMVWNLCINFMRILVKKCSHKEKVLKISAFFVLISSYTIPVIVKKNPQPGYQLIVDKVVDNVDNYKPSKDSPIETTSPAPIVINKSPLVQFSSKKS